MINPQKPVINLITNFNRFTALVETLENPFYVSAAENSYASERSYKTGFPLSHKFEEQH